MIWSGIVSQSMMRFKSFKELHKDLLLSLLSLKDIWMLRSIVNSFNVVDIKIAVTIFVQLFESLCNKLLSEWVHGSSESSDELIIVNCATSVHIEVTE
jgi:hypothetical protein